VKQHRVIGVLTMTVAFLAANVAASANDKPPSAQSSDSGGDNSGNNELSATNSTFYIVAPGSDNSVSPVVHSLTHRLQALFDRASGAGTIWVLPRLSWGPNDLADQCADDPAKDDPKAARVLGGIILEGTNTYSSIDPLVLWSHGWAKVTSDAELVSCAPLGFENPTITWVSNDVNGYGSRNGVAFENLAAAAVLIFSRSSEAKAVAVGVAVGGESGASAIPPVNESLSTRDAAIRVAGDLIDKLNASCAGPHNETIWPICAKLGLPQAKVQAPPE
jgi:hypothetical protein